MQTSEPAPTYDVAILGSGLGGSTLAAILAARGFSTLLLESEAHPRFAVGESVVPEFGARARILAEYFGVPELEHLGNFQSLRHHVSANSGIKRNFSFLWHADGQEHRGAETCQFQTMTYPLGPDSHVYRPDLDAWLTALAVRYGATYRDRTRVEAIDIDGAGVTLVAGSTSYRARFLVDGSGHRSLLASRFSLRREPDFGTDTRTIFTHMVGVRGIRAARRNGGAMRVPSPPDQGTLHHIFDGGWFWIIPFNNHSLAVNPAVSVGLTLDRRKYPDNERPAEEEFFEFAGRFPTIGRQLASARAIRSWVKTRRVQYRSAKLSGDRWCLLPHAANFIDALFSGGMTLTLSGVQEVAKVLVDGLPDDRISEESFAPLEEGTRENLEALDKVVHGAYVAMRSHALFNAWYRVWAVANYHGSAALNRLHLRYLASGRREFLEQIHEKPFRRILGTDHPRVRGLVDDAYVLIQELESGSTTEEATVDGLFALLGRQDWIPPQFRVTDRRRSHLTAFTVFPLLSIIFWGKRRAPLDMKSVYYDVGPIFFWELTKSLAREGRRSISSFLRVARGAHFSRGHD